MPTMKPETKEYLEEFLKNAKPMGLYIDQEIQEQALLESKQYLAKEIEDIQTLLPLSIYYILAKLSSNEQIKFIKDHIDYLKENDDSIFLYGMEEPKELSYYFSYNVLATIYDIDESLFDKIMNGTVENIFNGFTHHNYILYFEKFKSYVTNMKSSQLFRVFSEHNRLPSEKIDINNLNEILKSQKNYNREFINYFSKNYKNKIDHFTPQELLYFISYFQDIDEYQKQVLNNMEKLKKAFQTIEDYDLSRYLRDYTNAQQQEILFSYFLEVIVGKQDIRKIISKISSNVIFRIYKENKDVFNDMTLCDWVKLSSKKHEFNDEFKSILDDYEIENISELYNKVPLDCDGRIDVSALQYIENKYRSILKENKYTAIDQISSIFSEEYFHNLKYLRAHLKDKTIFKSSKEYEENLAKFILYLKENHIVIEFDDLSFREINKLFYRIVMGSELTNLINISCIQEITILNRLKVTAFNDNLIFVKCPFI